MCQFRHNSLEEGISVETWDNYEKSKATENDNNHENNIIDNKKELEEASTKVKLLEVNKIEMEKKLKLYSAAIWKLRSERETEC